MAVACSCKLRFFTSSRMRDSTFVVLKYLCRFVEWVNICGCSEVGVVEKIELLGMTLKSRTKTELCMNGMQLAVYIPGAGPGRNRA